MRFKGLGLLLLVFSVGCQSDSPEKRLAAAQEALGKGTYAEAAAAAAAGLKLEGGTPATMWRLQLTQLEALARGGDVDATSKTLAALADQPNSQVKATLFVSTADQLRAAGKSAGAVQLLDQGAKKFPDDPAIQKAIEQAKTSKIDAELEALRSLGYIDD